MEASQIFLETDFNTKDEEEKILNDFLQRLNYKSKNIVEYEKPDFEVEINEILVGIEITKYYSDETKKGSKSHAKILRWKHFAMKLRNCLIERNEKFCFLYGAIHFIDTKKTDDFLKEPKAIDELVDLIIELDLDEKVQLNINIGNTQFEVLKSYIDQIYLEFRFDRTTYLWWASHFQSGSVNVNLNKFFDVIAKKEKSSSKYKNIYQQKWLLIYAGGLALNDICYINEKGSELIRQGKLYLLRLGGKSNFSLSQLLIPSQISYFSHVFIFDKFTEKIWEVYPNKRCLFDYQKKELYVNRLPILPSR